MVNIAPDTRSTISIDNNAIKYIVGKTRLNKNQVIQAIENVLQETLDLTIRDLDIWIDDKVPKRTGQLRFFLKQSLRASSVQLAILRLRIGTNLEYAEDVAQMPQANVRHLHQQGYVYYPNIYGIRGRVILNDPRAVGFFWRKLLEYAIERLKIHFAQSKARHLTGRTGQLIRTRLNVQK